MFTNNCLFHFSPLRLYKLKEFENELFFNEASCLRFSSKMTVLQLPFKFSCCWSNCFQKILVGKASFLSLWINILFKRYKQIRYLASLHICFYRSPKFCIYLLCGRGLVIDVNSTTNGWECLELKPLRNVHCAYVFSLLTVVNSLAF